MADLGFSKAVKVSDKWPAPKAAISDIFAVKWPVPGAEGADFYWIFS